MSKAGWLKIGDLDLSATWAASSWQGLKFPIDIKPIEVDFDLTLDPLAAKAIADEIRAAVMVPAKFVTVQTFTNGSSAPPKPTTYADVARMWDEMQAKQRAREAQARKAAWIEFAWKMVRNRPFVAKVRRLIGWFDCERN